jgi:PIN domain nuclease of toxin-antitoxin system
VNLLLDTHLLIWAAAAPQRLSPQALDLIHDPANTLHFSVASVWEAAIKASLGRDRSFPDASVLRRGLIENGYVELPITAQHALMAGGLPPLHGDPFDRMLVAQAQSEGLVLLTADAKLAAYGAVVRLA